MASFKDSKNRDWIVSVDVATIKVVRARLSIDNQPVDLTQIANKDGVLLDRLARDVCFLVDLLWVLCEEQAPGKNVDEIEFARGLVGDGIDSASSALIEAMIDFFPRERRELLKAMWAKSQEVETLIMDQAKQDVAEMAPTEIAKRIMEQSPGS